MLCTTINKQHDLLKNEYNKDKEKFENDTRNLNAELQCSKSDFKNLLNT